MVEGALECHSDVHAEAPALRGTRSLTPRISHTVTSNTVRVMCKGFICYLHTLSLSLSLSLSASAAPNYVHPLAEYHL